jgi:hypothetical protein
MVLGARRNEHSLVHQPASQIALCLPPLLLALAILDFEELLEVQHQKVTRVARDVGDSVLSAPLRHILVCALHPAMVLCKVPG